jgi:hypothetical protein
MGLRRRPAPSPPRGADGLRTPNPKWRFARTRLGREYQGGDVGGWDMQLLYWALKGLAVLWLVELVVLAVGLVIVPEWRAQPRGGTGEGLLPEAQP